MMNYFPSTIHRICSFVKAPQVRVLFLHIRSHKIGEIVILDTSDLTKIMSPWL